MRILALQSGTSADGIDAALVDIAEAGDGLEVEILATGTEPWLAGDAELNAQGLAVWLDRAAVAR